MTVEVTPFGGHWKGQSGPTGMVIMRLTMDSRGEIAEGACLEGPNRAPMVLIECPIDEKKTRLILQHKNKTPPFWWTAKHQRLAAQYLTDKQMKMEIVYKRRQQKCGPSGFKTDDYIK